MQECDHLHDLSLIESYIEDEIELEFDVEGSNEF